jgi:hypothetical protein
MDHGWTTVRENCSLHYFTNNVMAHMHTPNCLFSSCPIFQADVQMTIRQVVVVLSAV